MKQIKPTIIYNETPWIPIVPLNYKTQITNTQWAELDINPRKVTAMGRKEEEENHAAPAPQVLRLIPGSQRAIAEAKSQRRLDRALRRRRLPPSQRPTFPSNARALSDRTATRTANVLVLIHLSARGQGTLPSRG